MLDLSKYIDAGEVFIRFRFFSNGKTVQPGSYIDDVQVSGRAMGSATEPRRGAGPIGP